MKKVIARFCGFIATLGPIGYVPFAPGTVATLFAVPLYFWYQQFVYSHGFNELLTTTFLIVLSYFLIKLALPLFYETDPQEIVLDEVIGLFITLYHFQFTPIVIIIGFFYFRLFDITKPFGLSALERLPGAYGVLADDIAAAAFAHFCLAWTLQFIGKFLL